MARNARRADSSPSIPELPHLLKCTWPIAKLMRSNGMNPKNESIKACVVTLFVTSAVVAGCNSGASPISSSGPPNGNSPGSSVQRDTVATTIARIDTGRVSGGFKGVYSPEPCWTVSPSPLPNYNLPKKIWVSYDSNGCSKRNITLTYESFGGSSTVYACDYKITYPIGGPFSYSTQNGLFTTCTATAAPPSKNYDEDLYYAIVSPLRAHHH